MVNKDVYIRPISCIKLGLLLNETFVSDCRYFPDIYISQGSASTRLRCDEIFNDQFITQSVMSPKVKKIGKSVNFCRNYALILKGN